LPTSQGELNAVFDAVDKKRSGKITYQQFVSAVHNDQSVRACLYNLYTHTRARARLTAPLSGTTQVDRYQKGKTYLDFTEARDNEWQWHQLGHMQVCTSLQTDNHASTPPL